MLEAVGIIAGIVFGGIMTLVAYLTWYEHQKKKRIAKFDAVRLIEKQNEKLEREKRDTRMKEEMIEAVDVVLEKKLTCYETKDEAKEGRKKIWKSMNNLEDELNNHYTESVKSELNRLSNNIVNFADDCRAGAVKSRVAFLHISTSYDRYKKLGGNHYVDEQYEYITDCMKSLETIN